MVRVYVAHITCLADTLRQSQVTDRAQETEKGVFNTHVRDTGKEQIVGAGAVAKDGGPSTRDTIADG